MSHRAHGNDRYARQQEQREKCRTLHELMVYPQSRCVLSCFIPPSFGATSDFLLVPFGFSVKYSQGHLEGESRMFRNVECISFAFFLFGLLALGQGPVGTSSRHRHRPGGIRQFRARLSSRRITLPAWRPLPPRPARARIRFPTCRPAPTSFALPPMDSGPQRRRTWCSAWRRRRLPTSSWKWVP